jgi:hypothetical protein
MSLVVAWWLVFMLGVVPVNVLWGRMRRVLDRHNVAYSIFGGHWTALARFRSIARQTPENSEERRLLRWVYLATAWCLIAFIGFVTSGIASFGRAAAQQ